MQMVKLYNNTKIIFLLRNITKNFEKRAIM